MLVSFHSLTQIMYDHNFKGHTNLSLFNLLKIETLFQYFLLFAAIHLMVELRHGFGSSLHEPFQYSISSYYSKNHLVRPL